MGGASGLSLETVGDRNGFVSGEKPWNRHVRWSGVDWPTWQREGRKAPALQRGRVTGSTGLPDALNDVAHVSNRELGRSLR